MTCHRTDLPHIEGTGAAASIVAFDLDGVLAASVWPDRESIGEPNVDAVEVLRHYAELGNNCVIYTARRAEDKQMIWDWVKKHKLPIEEVYCGAKPIAGLYIDDRAWRWPTGRHVKSREFHGLLQEIGDLHDKKQLDYGSERDPFANVRASEEFGIPAWVGSLMRANDKMVRLKNFAMKGELANESAEDSMYDIAVYVLIALILYRQATEPKDLTIEWDASDIKQIGEGSYLPLSEYAYEPVLPDTFKQPASSQPRLHLPLRPRKEPQSPQPSEPEHSFLPPTQPRTQR